MTIDAVGLALRRARSRPGLVVATALTVLLAVTLVTAAALTTTAAGRGSVAAALARSEAVDRLVVVTARDAEATGSAADDAVRRVLDRSLGPVSGTVTRRVVSTSYLLPGGTPAEPLLGLVATYQGLSDRADLVAGRWPAAGDSTPGVLEVVIHRDAASALGLAPGDRVEAVNRLDDSTLPMRVVGTMLPSDTSGGYWAGDPLGVSGIDRGGSFVTYGPFFAADGSDQQIAGAEVAWRAEPDLAALDPQEVSQVRGTLAQLLEEGPDELVDVLGAGATVESDLDEVLTAVTTPVAVARAAVGLPLALVVLLALTAVVLLTRLVQEDRAPGASLEASRGFSASQLWFQNAVEALLVTVPAVLVAPLVAWLSVRGASAAAGAEATAASVELTVTAWVWAALAGATVVVVLVRRGVTAGGRGRVRAAWSRLGLDLVVVPLAAVAAVRVLISGDGAGGVDVFDPLLVLTGPLVLLAVALVVGRVARLGLLLGAQLAARSRGVVASVASWQLARRADEHRAMLVAVLLATSVAAFAASYLVTASSSHDSRASLAVGADVRVVGLEGVADAERLVTEVGRAGGVAMTVTRERTAVGDLPVDVLAVDGELAEQVLATREQGSWPSLLGRLGEEGAGPVPAVVDEAVGARAGEAQRVRVRVSGTDIEVAARAEAPDLPGVGPEADAAVGATGVGNTGTGTGILVDRDALAAVTRGLDSAETEVWASVPRTGLPALRAAVDDANRGRSGEITLQDRWTVAESQRQGPVGAGLRVALITGLASAFLLGVTGFLAAAVAGLRRRRTEVASLRATGLSREQVRTSLLGERAGLLGVAAFVGVVAGAGSAAVLLPRVILTEAGTRPAPPVAVDVPWIALTGAVLAVALVSTALLDAAVRRLVSLPVGDELRRGEDT